MTDSTLSSQMHIGRVIGIALRPAVGAAMRLSDQAQAVAHGALQGDIASSVRRGITLISSRQWQQTIDELGVDLPWHTRRANVLVETDSLLHLISHTIAIGPVRVKVHNETKPCQVMDQLHPGLMHALVPQGRGGVYGEILTGGIIRVGDPVALADNQACESPGTSTPS